MKFRLAHSKLVACGSIALLFSVGSALGQGAAQPSGIPFHPTSLKKAVPPPAPKHGPHKIESHGKATHAAVAKHAADSCDHLAHHFVGSVSHDAFMTECHHTH